IPLWFYGEEIAKIFSEDPEVIYLAGLMFKVIALYQAMDGAGIILRSALGGAGDTFIPSVIMIANMVLVMLPCVLVFSDIIEPGMLGAWIGGALYIAAIAVALWVRFNGGKWTQMELRRT
ncbi:MAG: MATE family efflux transporter, partial [Pseudomonadota bacterium]